MLKKYIYLAGPIAGLNEQEATEWRSEVQEYTTIWYHRYFSFTM